jgi:hypothetical protein
VKPAYYPLTIYAGTTLDAAALNFTYKVGGIPVDLSGATIQASGRDAKGNLLFDWSTTNGKLTLDGPAGVIAFNLSAEDTAMFNTLKMRIHGMENNMPIYALGSWSMEVVTNRVERLMQGPVFVSREHVYA